MARRSKSTKTVREHLLIAAQAVHDQHPDVAATLEELRSPLGFKLLQDPAGSDDQDATGVKRLNILVPEHLRHVLQEAALEAADDGVSSAVALGRTLDRKFADFLAGDVVPQEIPREARGQAAPKVAMHAEVNAALLERVQNEAAEIGARAGYQRKASATWLSLALLLDAFGVEYAATPSTASTRTTRMNLLVPPALAKAIRAKLTDFNDQLTTVVEEGLTKVAAGEWQPFEVPKAAKGSSPEREPLSPPVDPELVARVRDLCGPLSKKLGFRVTPPSVAIAYLTDQLGLDDVFAEAYDID